MIKSFKACALTEKPDGSENNEIHCLKEGEPLHGALSQLLTTENATEESRNVDPFEHITESDVEEEDVTMVDFDDEEEIDIVVDNQTLTALAFLY